MKKLTNKDLILLGRMFVVYITITKGFDELERILKDIKR